MAKTRLESNIEMYSQSEYHQPIYSNGKIMRFANSIQFLSFLKGSNLVINTNPGFNHYSYGIFMSFH